MSGQNSDIDKIKAEALLRKEEVFDLVKLVGERGLRSIIGISGYIIMKISLKGLLNRDYSA